MRKLNLQTVKAIRIQRKEGLYTKIDRQREKQRRHEKKEKGKKTYKERKKERSEVSGCSIPMSTFNFQLKWSRAETKNFFLEKNSQVSLKNRFLIPTPRAPDRTQTSVSRSRGRMRDVGQVGTSKQASKMCTLFGPLWRWWWSV